MTKRIGKNIKYHRLARNLTQKELAERVHVTPQAVSKWENHMGTPDVSQIVPLAEVLRVSTDELLGKEQYANGIYRPSNVDNSNDLDDVVCCLGWEDYCKKAAGETFDRRDILGKLFQRDQWYLHRLISREAADEIARVFLGSEEVKTFTESPNKPERVALQDKRWEYFRHFRIQKKIVEICQIIGVTNLYDFRCHGINQGIYMIPYTNMTYTGINEVFYFRDWWGDKNAKNILNSRNTPYVDDPPPSFCHGRIRFVKGRYPDVRPDVLPNSIALGNCSFTTYRGRELIQRTATALHEDFDRILINLPWCDIGEAEDHGPTLLATWKEADWSGYEVHPIGAGGYLYATRFHEDTERLKAAFPHDEKGRIDTGLGSFSDTICGWWGDTMAGEPYDSYIEW